MEHHHMGHDDDTVNGDDDDDDDNAKTVTMQASDCLTRRRPQVHCAHNRHQPRPGRGEIFIFIMILRLLCHNRIKGGVNSC